MFIYIYKYDTVFTEKQYSANNVLFKICFFYKIWTVLFFNSLVAVRTKKNLQVNYTIIYNE